MQKQKQNRNFFFAWNGEVRIEIEAALPQPVYAWVSRIALRFESTYVGFHRHIHFVADWRNQMII